MERDNHQSDRLVDLGEASRATLGGVGEMIDFVRYMEHWGISRD